MRRPGVSISIVGEPSLRFKDAFPSRAPNREGEAGEDRPHRRKENVGTSAMTFLKGCENTLDKCSRWP